MLVIVLGAVAIDFAFRSLLVDQVQLRLAQTADEIERAALEGSTFGFPGDGPLTLVLSDRATLDHWGSASQYIQIDTLAGQILGKSSNVGGFAFPPVAPPHEAQYGELRVRGERPGTMLVLDRALHDAEGRPVAIAHIGQRLDIVDALIARARAILLGVASAAAIVIVIVAYFVAASAIDPIERLTSAVAEIGSEHLDRRLRWRRRDEVGRLAAAFDAMLDRLQSAFARERQFISDASHELRTPLTVINANAQMLQRWGSGDPAVAEPSLTAIADESARLAHIVAGMLTLAKAESGDAIATEPLDLAELVDDVVRTARERADAKGLALTAHRSGTARTIVQGDAALLRQLVVNLLDNALKFTPAGRVDIWVVREDEQVVLVVADTGAGLGTGAGEHLFDRFFRGDPAHARTVEGTGLGLAIVRSIVRVHGGTVDGRSLPDGGAAFTVRLPAGGAALTDPS